MPYSIYISNKDVLEKDKIFFFFNQVLQLLKFQQIKITSYIIPPLNTHTCTKAKSNKEKVKKKYNKINFKTHKTPISCLVKL